MKSTSPILLIASGVVATAAGAFYGTFQVSHGHPLPVSHPSSLLTMPVIALILVLLALPIFRYRKALLELAKAGTDAAGAARAGVRPPVRPKRLDPFYAVRVLLLAKSTSVASAVIAGFQLGLVLLQLATPVIAVSIWLNVLGVIGAVLSLVVALLVERACKIPDGGADSAATGGAGGVAV
ncbi:MAG: DUF3180 family protein [Actinomycetales bacterium]|nr:DUF3180 family protein [Actinomycetales bacterium]